MPRIVSLGLALSVLPAALAAQQKAPAIRPLGAVTAHSDGTVGAMASVRALPGGRVLVNDPQGRRLLLLDSTLSIAHATVVADSTAATANAYSGRIAGIIPYRGDSTLFVDPQSMSMLLIDPGGKLGRVMSVPRSQDVMALAGPFAASAGFDGTGHLVYRAMPRFNFARPAGGTPGAVGSPMPPLPPMPESLSIVRVDLATRAVDTLGRVKINRPNMQVTQDDKGNVNIVSEVNPLPVVDEWAVTSSGTVVMLRGRDYHVDWIRGDGTRGSAPKMPFDWQRLSDEDKVAFIDSVKAARERLVASLQANATQAGSATGSAPAAAAAPRPAEGEMRVQISTGPGSGGPSAMPMAKATFVSPSELPDYKPPFFANSVRADLDDHVWVRTIPTRAIAGGPVYDVVSSTGELVDRVQIPVGRTIAGFGRNVVYLATRGADGSVTLESAAIR